MYRLDIWPLCDQLGKGVESDVLPPVQSEKEIYD